jgi:hypothetical protein
MLLTTCLSAALCVKKTKRKKEEFVWFLLDAYRFLSIRKPTMAIAMMMAIVEAVK